MPVEVAALVAVAPEVAVAPAAPGVILATAPEGATLESSTPPPKRFLGLGGYEDGVPRDGADTVGDLDAL